MDLPELNSKYDYVSQNFSLEQEKMLLKAAKQLAFTFTAGVQVNQSNKILGFLESFATLTEVAKQPLEKPIPQDIGLLCDSKFVLPEQKVAGKIKNENTVSPHASTSVLLILWCPKPIQTTSHWVTCFMLLAYCAIWLIVLETNHSNKLWPTSDPIGMCVLQLWSNQHVTTNTVDHITKCKR